MTACATRPSDLLAAVLAVSCTGDCEPCGTPLSSGDTATADAEHAARVHEALLADFTAALPDPDSYDDYRAYELARDSHYRSPLADLTAEAYRDSLRLSAKAVAACGD